MHFSLQALDSVGFKTVLTVTDGHRVNVKFFTQLSGGQLRIRIPHPESESVPMFLHFNPIHVMKNFYNNFQRKGYE